MKFKAPARSILAIGLIAVTACQSFIGAQDTTIVSECVNANDCGPGKTCSSTFTCVPVECVGAGCVSLPPGSDAGGNDPRDGEADAEEQKTEGGDASGELIINPGALPPGLCAGATYSVQLEARGGVSPYTWSVMGVTVLELSNIDNARVQVSFTPYSGSSFFDVFLHDSSGHDAHRSIDLGVVNETPRVVTPELPVACPAQVYTATLAAEGGDAQSYQWSSVGALPAQIALSGNTFIASPTTPGDIVFSVTVDDGHCKSTPTSITVPVHPVGPGDCPAILTAALPAPCAGSDYRQSSFDVAGGTQPPVWEALPPLPVGFDFAGGENPQLFGTAPAGIQDGAATTLTLRVTDGGHRQVQKTYSLAARQKCWLGYISTETGPSRLRLFDPVLGAKPLFPASAADTSQVIDFKFSPDGNFAAYRLVPPAGDSQLVVLAAPRWVEQPLALSGDVRQYAWSPDSSTLAVAVQTGAGPALTGATVSCAVSSASDADAATSAIPCVHMLNPVPSFATSELDWFGPGLVAFAAEDALGFSSAYYARLAEGAFGAPTKIVQTSYVESPLLRPGSAGFFALTSSDFDFYGIGDGNSGVNLNQYGGGVADPAGRYVAAAHLGQLQILPTAATAVVPATPPLIRGQGCGVVLAWAPEVERIACATDPVGSTTDAGAVSTSPDGPMSIFDWNDSTPSPTGKGIRESYDYSENESVERRRAFSPTGDWLAFSTDGVLNIANLRDSTPRMWAQHRVPQDAMSESPLSDLFFSPNEGVLLWHRGTRLVLLDLTDSKVWFDTLIAEPLAVPDRSSDQFIDGPDNWCGSTGSTAPIVWSPDSRFAAVRTAGGKLLALNLAVPSAPSRNPACSQGCSNRFAFQP
jgi:hypothetical protein